MADDATSWQPKKLPATPPARAPRGGAGKASVVRAGGAGEDLAHLAPVKVTWKPEPPAAPPPA